MSNNALNREITVFTADRKSSLRASSPRSRVLARLASLAQIGELARRLREVRNTGREVHNFLTENLGFNSILIGRELNQLHGVKITFSCL